MNAKQRLRSLIREEVKKILRENINPKSLIGHESLNYNGDEGTIISAAFVRDYFKLKRYDRSGWMHPGEFENLSLDPMDILVAFKEHDSGDIEVYTYGDGGVEKVDIHGPR